MKYQVTIFFILCLVLQVNSAIISEPEKLNFQAIRDQLQICSKAKCKDNVPIQKFPYSEALRNYVAKQSRLSKGEKPSFFETRSKLEEINVKVQSDNPNVKRQPSEADNFYSAIQQAEIDPNFKPSDEFTKSLLTFPEKNQNIRLLQSMGNEYDEYNEGNIQANLGSKYIYEARRDSFNQHNVWKITTSGGVTVFGSVMVTISSNFYLRDILVSNQVLLIIGWVQGWTLVFKYPLNANGDLSLFNYAYFYKYGSPIASRERNNRALIVTNQALDTINYYWQIGGSSIPFTSIPANSLGFTSGSYQNAVRAVWNIGMNNNLGDYYFEEYLFGDWINFINIGNSENLYLFSQSYNKTYSTFNVQIVESAITTPYGASYPSSIQNGIVSNSFQADQFDSMLRVVAFNYNPIDAYYYKFNVPTLLVEPVVNVGYNSEYLQAVLFVKELAYLVYRTNIKVTTGVNSGTDYPTTLYVQSLHKFASNATLVTNYLIGFAYNITSANQYRPVVLLYKILPAQPLVLATSYQLSQNDSVFSSNYYYNHQGLLIDWNSKSVVFAAANPYSPQPNFSGMYYLKVILSPPCLTPYVSCQPNPPSFALVYKHWDAVTGSVSEFLSSTSEDALRFTIVSSGVNTYLYSSSKCQFQARQLNGTPLPVNTVNRVDLCV